LHYIVRYLLVILLIPLLRLYHEDQRASAMSFYFALETIVLKVATPDVIGCNLHALLVNQWNVYTFIRFRVPKLNYLYHFALPNHF